MIGYFTYILIVMRKTQRQEFTFEFLVLLIEIIKLGLVLLHEFVFVSVVFLVVIMILQSQIRAIVNANFIKQYLEIKKQQSKLRSFYIVYYSIIVSMNVSMLILSILPATRESCDQDVFCKGWLFLIFFLAFQLYVVSGVDMIQSILIAYFAIQLKKIVKARKESEILRFSSDQKELIKDD